MLVEAQETAYNRVAQLETTERPNCALDICPRPEL
jgi:hypothetical protein